MAEIKVANDAKLRRKKRISKKTKKGWRKGSDVKDVEQYLEQARNDERTGLFDSDKSRFFFVEHEDSKKRDKRATKELNCHRGLSLDSSIPPLHISQKVSKSAKKKVSKPVKNLPPKVSRKRPAKSDGQYDLWGADATPGEELDEHFAYVCKKRRIKPPTGYGTKPSAIQTIEAPHPGASYNPSQSDHQELLKKAVEVEEKKEKAEKRLKRALDEMFPTASEFPAEGGWIQEMSAGLTNEPAETDDKTVAEKEGGDEEAEATSSSHNCQAQKKTEKQRRHEKERLVEERTRQKEKEEKLRENQKFRIKTITKELKERERKLAVRAAWRELEREEKKSQPKRLGKLKYEEPNIDVKLSEELVGSLRQVKPEGHVAELMFKHLQKKNVIEPRKRAKPQPRIKAKLFEKKAHKAVTL